MVKFLFGGKLCACCGTIPCAQCLLIGSPVLQDYHYCPRTEKGHDSSVIIATLYVLDGPGIECRWGRDVPHMSNHPAFYTMGTGSFPGVKRPGRDVYHPLSSSAKVEERVQLQSVAYPGIFFGGGGFNKFSLGQRTERTGIWGRQPPSQGIWRQLQFGTRNFISYTKIFLIFGTLDYL